MQLRGAHLMSTPREGDAAIDALSSEARELLGQRWLARAQNELCTSTTFAELYRGLVALEASPALLAVAARAVGDELRHSEICHALAERYAGRPPVSYTHLTLPTNREV